MTESNLNEKMSRNAGREAQRSNIAAAKAVADIIKTTLGPKGMDKMLIDSYGGSVITNDGVTILREMEIDHPAAKMLVDIAKTQESEAGDGTTSAVLIAGKMLENAEKLLDRKIHPTVIVKGYEIAAEQSMKILKEIETELESKEMLYKIASTAMTGKGAEGTRIKLGEIIVNAVDKVSDAGDVNKDFIKITKVRGDSVGESGLVDGMVIEKERAHIDMPPIVEKAKILLIDFPIELKGTEGESKISITSPEQLEMFVENEERRIKKISDLIILSGAKVVFCQKGIDDVAQYYLAKSGIMGVRRVSKSDLEKIAKASSGKIISNMREIGDEKVYGYAEIVEEKKIGDENLIFIRGCKNPKAVSIILRGASEHSLDETQRAVEDALGDVISALKSKKIVAGGGAVEIEMARRLRMWSKSISGKEQLAVEEFANSLEGIPEALAENAGLDPIETVAELRKMHESGGINIGLNLITNTVEDTLKAGIIEPSRIKEQAISSASEVAKTILRIDDILISKSRKQEERNQYSEMD